MRSANEAQAVGAFEIDAGEDDNSESTGTEEEVRCADGLLVAARADEQGAIIPEGASDGERTVDPRGAIAGGDARLTGCAKNRRGSALWFAGGKFAKRESAVWERAIEFRDAGGCRTRGTAREGHRIGKLLLEQCSEFGELGGCHL